MLVPVQALRRIVFLKAIAFEVSEEGGFDGDLVFADYQSLTPAYWLEGFVPGVLLDLISCQPFVRVCLQNLINQVDALGR